MSKTPTPVGPVDGTHWYAETPVLVELLAAKVHTTITDVCEQLEANTLDEDVSDEQAVIRFIDDYVAA